MPSILSIGTAQPAHRCTTAELVDALAPRLSDEIRATIASLGVDARRSVFPNYAAVLHGASIAPTESTTTLAARAVRSCLERSGRDPEKVGLLAAVTNTPAELLPGLAPALLAELHGLLPPSLATVSLQGQGCSALLKALDVARWFITAHPDREALVVAAEVQTPLMPPTTAARYLGFREIARLRKTGALDEDGAAQARLDTQFLTQALLFGDGAVALRVGGEGEEQLASIGPVAHATNIVPEDSALLVMPEGGSFRPHVAGKPRYLMHPGVPARGAEYAARTVRDVLSDSRSPIRHVEEVAALHVHTGSRKILDGVCDRLGVARSSPRVAASYEVLRRNGNLSSASVGFMLAHEPQRGPALVVSFGVGFSASAAVLTYENPHESCYLLQRNGLAIEPPHPLALTCGAPRAVNALDRGPWRNWQTQGT